MLKVLRPELVYYIFNATLALARSMFIVMFVYYVNMVKMDPLQLVLVGTVLELTYFLSELPTGIAADAYSRRLSVIIGVFTLSAAWILEGSVPVFISILAATAISAVGEAFLSGATQAWLADEVDEEKVGPIFIRSGQINRIVYISATFGVVALGSWRLNLPIIIAGILCLMLGIFLVLFMGERGFKPLPRQERNNWQIMFTTFRRGISVVKGSAVLIVILLISVVSGISSEGYDRLWGAHLLTNLTFPDFLNLKPVVWFGVISVSISLLSLVVTEVNRRRLEAVSRNPVRTARWLMILSVLTVLTGIGLALTGHFALAFAAVLVHGLVGSVSFPLFDAWLIQHIRPEARATVISIIGQVNAIGQIAGGPGVGAVGKMISIRAALTFSALLCLPIPFLYGWASHRKKEETSAQAE